jgi:hypothetical protein
VINQLIGYQLQRGIFTVEKFDGYKEELGGSDVLQIVHHTFSLVIPETLRILSAVLNFLGSSVGRARVRYSRVEGCPKVVQDVSMKGKSLAWFQADLPDPRDVRLRQQTSSDTSVRIRSLNLFQKTRGPILEHFPDHFGPLG